MKLVRHIPNFLTCCNLLCGCIGILADKPTEMSYWIFAGMIFDFSDGLAARLLKASSESGKQLDSLADLVTFGVLPGMIFFQILTDIQYLEVIYDESQGSNFAYLAYTALLIPVFSALRLAKFNLDNRQSNHFKGLPTPASALLVASFPWILETNYLSTGDFLHQNSWILVFFIFLIAYLLVSDISLFSLKFKNSTTAKSRIVITFLGISLSLFVILHFLAVPLIMSLYFIFSYFYFKK
ncbi:MAG: CDP-alcohol phosphatidyltransferase family protein [Microscillaceae bacterium]|nr:CDP-alcohol phosphatidyltransferase family protein [Microscillaceae bacterium]